jgi:hypothetical protein
MAVRKTLSAADEDGKGALMAAAGGYFPGAGDVKATRRLRVIDVLNGRLFCHEAAGENCHPDPRRRLTFFPVCLCRGDVRCGNDPELL